MSGVISADERPAGTSPAGAPAPATRRRTMPRWLPPLVGFGAVVVAVAIWELLATQVVHSILFPTPTSTGQAFWNLLTDSSSRGDIRATVWRIVKGFLAGSATGILLGVPMGLSSVGQFLIEPQVNFFRFVTPIALITPVSVWLGVNELTTFVLVVYATTWPVTLSTCAGMRAIVPNRVRMTRSFSSDGFWAVARHIILPSLIPHVVVGMRLGLSYSFMTVAGLEMLAGANGIGHLIYTERVFYRSDIMFAGIMLLGILGFIGDRIFVLVMDRSLGRFSYGNGQA